VDIESVVCELGGLEVDLEASSVDIGFGVSLVEVGLSLDPKVVSSVDIAVCVLIGGRDVDLEVVAVYIGFGVSPKEVGTVVFWVDIKCVVPGLEVLSWVDIDGVGCLDVDFETPSEDIGFGVSPIEVGP